MRLLFFAITYLIFITPAFAGITEQMDAHRKIGYAKAAIKACPSLTINPKGILSIVTKLDATDQATVASGADMTNYSMGESSKLLSMLGDSACAAALDFEKKMGIDLFIQK